MMPCGQRDGWRCAPAVSGSGRNYIWPEAKISRTISADPIQVKACRMQGRQRTNRQGIPDPPDRRMTGLLFGFHFGLVMAPTTPRPAMGGVFWYGRFAANLAQHAHRNARRIASCPGAGEAQPWRFGRKSCGRYPDTGAAGRRNRAGRGSGQASSTRPKYSVNLALIR